ncbi:acetylxylan esterase [Actinomyces sp. Z3]|uniref:acetylxylan esterase n=1 Tax=Actinomyces sp. Z3 TaxID=2250217 RepID=UPI000DCF481A|nr:acetylxylan esterase [Actinomyces sp. Z3]RAX21705.1 acetylxylan esterase [Actinomyces sp. Z3]
MAYFDLPPSELEDYSPELPEPKDFDAFWAHTLAQNPFDPASVSIAPVTTPLRTHRVQDVTFGGYAGDPIRAWLIAPADQSGPLPAVVEFLGMGGGRGLPQDNLAWAAAGYAHLVMDTRGQGSHWGSGGDTPDPHGTGPAAAGFATHGLQSPEEYLYRRLFVDAHHAVEAAAVLPEVDASRIAVTGVSQGGGLTLAAAGLNHRVIAAMPDVPFMCALTRAVGLTDDPPYADIAGYLAVHRDEVEQVRRTLAYFDGALLGARATCPALFSTGLMDTTCPPSTVFAARNRWGQAAVPAPARPEIRVYPFNGHEGGESYQWREQVAWLAALHQNLE